MAPRIGLAQVESGFDFCPPPFPPRCVQDEATYVSPDETAKCQEEVNRYVASVGAYRLCLTRETERAVRETNATLQLWKCSLSNDKALCK
ncbi:MAG: hypothetical protein NVSMB26_16010 [Beijerinckiaceae bacterium]